LVLAVQYFTLMHHHRRHQFQNAAASAVAPHATGAVACRSL